MTVKERLAALRAAMKTAEIDALIIPANDPHQSEYVAECWKTRTYFSGFTGSAGLLVILADYAALWTDSRYFLQADTELKDTGITLHKQQVQHAPEHVAWLANLLSEQATVGIEGNFFSIQQVAYLQAHFQPKNIELKDVDGIFDAVWTGRPSLPDTIAYEHDVKYTGRSRDEKLTAIRQFMSSQNVQHYFVSALDEIAWTLNVCAWDIDFTPVVLSYMIINETEVHWFVEGYKVPDDLRAVLAASKVQIHEYANTQGALAALPASERVYVDQANLSWSFQKGMQATIIAGQSALMPMMALKNETEIAHFREVMVKDGVALTRFFKWLEEEVQQRGLKETELAEKISYFRSLGADYKGESFPAIVGYKGNGAIVHYRAEASTCATIQNEGMLLVDSGGQYLNGTTDITRTICFGTPTDEQKQHYTLVLKGNLALQTAHFPKGTTGVQLDVLARMNLWREGLSYGHGTGHGVGFFLRVHEPPQGFAETTTTLRGSTPLQATTVSSNEPGYYKTGEYGIRIENLMLCVPSDKNENFLAFEAITLFPIATNLIDKALLSEQEVAWLNAYHQQVYDAFVPHLDAAEKAWLAEKCKAI